MSSRLHRFRLRLIHPLLTRQERDSDQVKMMLGQMLADRARDISALREAEFKVFSQFGEDGILQFLVHNVPLANDIFVEIGVEDYSESNTRFLLMKDNWKGYIFDQGVEHIDYVRRTDLGWRYDITPYSVRITRDNVDGVLEEAGVRDDISVFSLDIDGNDYWVLDALSVVSPRILVVEYNSIFGASAAITVPYDPDFERYTAHYSGLYWGASLAALNEVATRKGYLLIGSNSAGNNAFFVRGDVVGDLPTPDVAEVYVRSRFREARDEQGRLTLLDPHREATRLIGTLPVWDVATDRTISFVEAVDGREGRVDRL